MHNALEQFRRKNGLTFAALGRRVGLSRATVLMHCKAKRQIGGDAAIRYAVELDIPIRELRPDLFKANI